MNDTDYQKLAEQLQAEVHGLQSKLDAMEKRLVRLEELLPKSMTTDDLWNKKGEK